MSTKEKIGIVASNKMDKTIVIVVEDRYYQVLWALQLSPLVLIQKNQSKSYNRC